MLHAIIRQSDVETMVPSSGTYLTGDRGGLSENEI
jgi:hypothetical protein